MNSIRDAVTGDVLVWHSGSSDAAETVVVTEITERLIVCKHPSGAIAKYLKKNGRKYGSSNKYWCSYIFVI